MDVGIVGFADTGERIARAFTGAGLRVAVGGVPAPRPGEATSHAYHASTAAMVRTLRAPRVVWLCVAPGRATELALQDVWPELAPGDVIVDAGEGDYRDAPRREAALRSVRIRFVDCAVRSAGASNGAGGATVLLGGDAAAVGLVEAQARCVAGVGSFAHCGAAGTGHYARMVLDAVASARARAGAEGAALFRSHAGVALPPALVAALVDGAGQGCPGAGTAISAAAGVGAPVVACAVAAQVPTPVLSLAAMLEIDRRCDRPAE